MKKAKKSNDAILKLNTKPHSMFGIVSFGLSFFVMGCVVSSIILSASKQELSQDTILLIGSLGWIGAMLNVAGLSMAIISEGAKDMNKIFAHIGLLLHFFFIMYHGYVVWFGFF